MKLEELTTITNIEKNAVIKDARGEIVARIDSCNSLLSFLDEVEVNGIDIDSNGTVWIDLCFDSNLSMIQHMKNRITALEEDLSDEYRVSCTDDVNSLLLNYASKTMDECADIIKALNGGEVWDYYLG